MAERTSYISLDRNILQWRHYTDPVCSRLFVHLLLTVFWDDGEDRGHEIKRGQRIVTVQELADELGLGYWEVYRATKKLVLSNEIAKQNCGKNLLLTVLNYDKYQKRAKVCAKQGAKQNELYLLNKNKHIKEETVAGSPAPPPPKEKEEANITFEELLARERNQ